MSSWRLDRNVLYTHLLLEKEVSMERQLLMSRKEACRNVEFEGVIAGRMSIRETSRRLGLSY